MTLRRSQGGARPTAAVLEQTDPKGNLEAVAGGGFRDGVAGVSGVNYRLRLGFGGSSRNSWSRTFVTNAARRISTVGGSLRDVQLLAGHSALSTTQRYIEADAMAQRKVVELV